MLDCNNCTLRGYCIPDECADATKKEPVSAATEISSKSNISTTLYRKKE